MKTAIIGLANSGKTTVFNALTGLNLEVTSYPTISSETFVGVVKVPDARITRLTEIYKPKKSTQATVEYIDFIGLTKGDMDQNRKVFDLIKDADALVHVVRGFADETVSHPMGSVNPRRDAETIELEMIFGDLELVEKRLDRMEEGAKRGKKPDEIEQKLLQKCKDALENETALRDVDFTDEEQKAMKSLQFMSIKPQLVVINVTDDEINSEKTKAAVESIREYFSGRFVKVISLSGKIEMEITQLSDDEAKAFLEDLGIEEPALNKLIDLSYDLLGFISFLTSGEDEVRAWTIKKGTDAQRAAGKIHSDIERGFIRAEVVAYNDFITHGSMTAAKEKGLVRLEGKTYVVKDGDIINFRFNV
ncbi:MAG: redox-regulated ATPase YchF [bacterium]